MKKVLSLFIITLICTSSFAQQNQDKSETENTSGIAAYIKSNGYDSEAKMTLHLVEFTVDTVKEMDEIDWDDIFGVFKANAAQDSIEVAVVLKDYKVKNENDVLMSIPRLRVAVSGQTKDTAELRARMIKNIEKTTKAIRKFKTSPK